MDEKTVVDLVEQTVEKLIKPQLDQIKDRSEERDRKVEERLTELNERFNNFAHRVFTFLEDQDRKLAAATNEINEKFNKVFSALDFVLKRVDTVETEYLAITQTLKRIETQLLSWNGRVGSIDTLHEKIDRMEIHSEGLEKRIKKLEKGAGGGS